MALNHHTCLVWQPGWIRENNSGWGIFIEESYPGTRVNVFPLYTLWRKVVHICLKGHARLPHFHCLWSRKYELSVTTISSGQLYLSHPCYFYSCNNTHYNGRHWFQSLFSVYDLRIGEPVTPNGAPGPRNLWHIQLEWKHLPLTPSENTSNVQHRHTYLNL